MTMCYQEGHSKVTEMALLLLSEVQLKIEMRRAKSYRRIRVSV